MDQFIAVRHASNLKFTVPLFHELACGVPSKFA